MADIPAQIRHGQVTGRFVTFLADAGDAGNVPDEVPLTGSVTLTPLVSVLQIPGATPPRTVLAQAIKCPVVDGWLCAPGATVPGVWVIATQQPDAQPSTVQWRASFEFPATLVPGPVVFDVPVGGTVDLSSVVPSTPVPGTVTVVSHEDRVAAESAAAEAQAALGTITGDLDALVSSALDAELPGEVATQLDATLLVGGVLRADRLPTVATTVDGLSDATPIGRAVAKAVDAATARDAIDALAAPLGAAGVNQVPYRDDSATFRWGSASEVVARALGWQIADDYNLDTTGGTTHTAAEVQAWLDAGIPYATGTITCSGTVTIKSDADLHLLTINYTGTGTAIRVGDPGGQLFRATVQAPQVVAAAKTALGWGQVAGSVGVQVANCYGCTVTFPRVVNFEVGVKVTGVPIGGAIQGTQQCSFFPLHLENNKVNFLVGPHSGTSKTDSGWANQCSVFGGRMSHHSTEGEQIPGVVHVVIADCPNTVNGWTFYGTSLESPNVVEYHADVWGQFNEFNRCRWENTGGDPSRRVRSNGVARSNVIRGGYEAGQITQVLAGGGAPFDTDTDRQIYRRSGTTTVPTVLLENPSSSSAAALTVMAAGAGLAGADPATAWCSRATAFQWAGKRSTDAEARLYMDYVNGRMYLGQGTASAVAYIEGTATSLRVGGSAHLLPGANSTQDLGASSLRWRSLRLSGSSGFFGSEPPASKPVVTGSRGGNAALGSLITALASYGLVTDSTTA